MSSFSDIQATVAQLKELVTGLVSRIQDIKQNQADAIAAHIEIEKLNARIAKLEADALDAKQLDSAVQDIVSIKNLIQTI